MKKNNAADNRRKRPYFREFQQSFFRTVPSQKKKSLWQFLFMIVLACMELGGILLLTFFFAALNKAEAIKDAAHMRYLFSAFPVLREYAADSRKFLLLLSLLPISFIVTKNACGYAVQRNVIRVGLDVAAYIGSGIMCRFIHMPYQWHMSRKARPRQPAWLAGSMLGECSRCV